MSELIMQLTSALAAGLLVFAAGLFASAALHKIRTFTEFTGFVAGYRLLPQALVRPASGVIVAAEIAAIAGALLLIPALALLPMLLLVLYAGAMVINLLRGRDDIDCGCGGTPMPISTTAVARNLLLAAAFGWAASRPIGTFDVLESTPALIIPALAFALCLGLFYAVFNQLEANRAIRRRLWQRSA
ncbi:MAG TPA: MauE/DoxX family redox-associated membrane protein [Pseudomonadales bacterium]